MLNEKLCFVNPDKCFGRVPRNVLELLMMKKGIPEVLSRLVINQSSLFPDQHVQK